ncbi:hypothetical protein TNCV_4926921 [Trichonephila clavipes]|nr:hypothetical protein TNCV_4926921 [Trichonephila clavipes]
MVYGFRPRRHVPMVITCSKSTYPPKFLKFWRIQPEITFDRRNYSNHDALRLNRERDEAPIVAEALGPISPCFKASLLISLCLDLDIDNGLLLYDII